MTKKCLSTLNDSRQIPEQVRNDHERNSVHDGRFVSNGKGYSVPHENVPSVNLVPYIVQAGIISVRDDGLATALELLQVVDHKAAEERAAVFYGRLIDDDFGTFGLDTLHHPLDAALAEVVAVRLHRQTVDPHYAFTLLVGTEVSVVEFVVEPCFPEYPVSDEVLASAVAVYYRLDKVLRNVRIVRKELLRVLREAVASVAETRVVVEVSDTRVQAHAPDDGGRVKTLHLRVGVELVEVAHTQGEVRVGEELDRLCLRKAHEKGLDVILYGSFLQEGGELVRCTVQTLVPLRTSDDDTARVQVVVQGLALPKELRREDDVPGPRLAADALRVAHRDGALDDHDRIGVDLHHQVYDLLNMARVEVVLHRVVVGRCRDDHVVGISVGGCTVEGSHQVQVLLTQVFLYVFVLDGGLTAVDHFHLLGNHVDGGDPVVLAQKGGYAQADVAGPGDGDADVFFIVHCCLVYSIDFSARCARSK